MTRKLRLTLASTLAVAALGVIAPAASAYVYWTNANSGTIGRANLDGSSPNQSFITGAGDLFGLAVGPNFIYSSTVVPASPGLITRANLDGTNANQTVATVAGNPYAVAVGGNLVYWTNVDTGEISRADLDGSNPNQTFITGANNPRGVAVDGNFVYWTNVDTATIGRANLNGSSPTDYFITSVGEPWGVAVDGNFVYWTNPAEGTISRADLDGSNPNQTFITGASAPEGLAVDGNHIYWANYDISTIGRANLDGSSPNQSFITGGCCDIRGVAVDSLPNPTISRMSKPTKRFLKVKVGCGDASACTLRLTGNKVGGKAALVPRTVPVGAGAKKTVQLAYTRALKNALKKGGRIKVTASNTVSDGQRSIVVRIPR